MRILKSLLWRPKAYLLSKIKLMRATVCAILQLNEIINRLNNIPYEILDSGAYRLPKVKSMEDSIDFILKHKCSVARYGDGEFRLMRDSEGEVGFQTKNMSLAVRLREILGKTENSEKIAICIPDIFGNLTKDGAVNRAINAWRGCMLSDRINVYKFINFNGTYLDSRFTRCYMDFLDSERARELIEKIKLLWKGRDVFIIEGEKTRFGVGNDLLASAMSINRILCPSINAFSKYEEILSAAACISTDTVVLIALGPTATVLAYDMANMGYQAIDIGHLDVEYEWLLRGLKKKTPIPGRYINEAGGMMQEIAHDEKYTTQIRLRII